VAKRRVEIDDLFRIRMVADPVISPDGERVAFVVSRLDREANGYTAAIWMAHVNGAERPYQYTSGTGMDFSPRWSPDGSHLAFISNRGASNQIHVMPANGGEARQITSGDDPASDITWSPDGAALYFVARTGKKFNETTDTRILRTLRNRMDGEGFWDGRRRQIFRIGVDEGSSPEQITEGDWDATQPAVSPDGSRLAFCSNREDDRDASTRMDVWIQQLESGAAERVTGADGSYGTPSWSSDGKRLAYAGHPVVEPYGPTTLDDLFVRDLDSGEDRSLLAGLDREPGNSAMADMRYNLPSQRPLWDADGQTLWTLVSDAGSVHVYRCPLEGARAAVATGARDIQSFSIAPNGTVAFAAAGLSDPTNVFVIDAGGERRLTDMNRAYLDEVELAGVEEVRFASDPGVEVHGWLLAPPAFNGRARYPAIIQVHGGPHGMYGTGFFHEMQLLAARGYVVLMPNPRGSTGYGQEWVAGTKEDWGGADYRDVMAGADYLASLDFVDSDRMGITGGSYGGYMVNWAIGQHPEGTRRFRAAVSQRSTANRASLYGTSDINWSYNAWEYGGSPYENPDFYRERSPLTYVANVTTPLLLLHSENDLRCPISQSEEFFTALKLHGKVAEFVRFPDESHGLSRIGQPKHRVERLERICGWFERYL
jgi:dipeptidyl aminopeptidase/acylaminoacyl peptidase